VGLKDMTAMLIRWASSTPRWR